MKELHSEARIIDLRSVKRDQPGANDTIAYSTDLGSPTADYVPETDSSRDRQLPG